MAKNGLIAAFIFTWAKALGEFGATLMVAGSMAMRTETLPIAIFMRLSSADIEGTVALILILVAIGLMALFNETLLAGRFEVVLDLGETALLHFRAETGALLEVRCGSRIFGKYGVVAGQAGVVGLPAGDLFAIPQ